LNLILIWPLGTGGPALATAVCAGIQAGILLWILIRRYDLKLKAGMRNMVIKTTIATLIMAGGGAWSLHTLSDFSALLQLLVTVPLCAALFGICSLVLKNPELQSLFRQAPQE
ncbi:MAG: polysaccharide biosynthesis C-terminal domain-containing protein, partial [Sedimentisphaerales bacterium]|nr:polysaccharide biosynthesis C-terminal domain-containing protein [Sedimentisphaerales bacterium]